MREIRLRGMSMNGWVYGFYFVKHDRGCVIAVIGNIYENSELLP